MLWRLNSTQVHLLGSVHILDEPGCQLSAAAEVAFRKADTVAFEHEISNFTIFLNPPGEFLSKRVPRSTFLKASKAWQDTRHQNTEPERRSPWAAAMAIGVTIAEKKGFKIELGVEAVLRTRAAPTGKAVLFLETMEDAFRGLALLWHLYDHGAALYQAGIQRSMSCVPVCRPWRRP